MIKSKNWKKTPPPSYILWRGCGSHIITYGLWGREATSPPFSFFFPQGFGIPSNTNFQERIVYTHCLQFFVSGSHFNSLKVDFCPYHHNETSLVKVKVLLYAIINTLSISLTTLYIQYCWLLFSPQKCLILSFQDTTLLVLPSLIICSVSSCWFHSLPSASSTGAS